MIKCSNVSVYIYTIMQFSGRNHLPVLIRFSNADRSCIKPTFSLIFFCFTCTVYMYMYALFMIIYDSYDHCS